MRLTTSSIRCVVAPVGPFSAPTILRMLLVVSTGLAQPRAERARPRWQPRSRSGLTWPCGILEAVLSLFDRNLLDADVEEFGEACQGARLGHLDTTLPVGDGALADPEALCQEVL